MTEKEIHEQLVKTCLSAAFWRAEYFPEFFTEDFTMDFPSAPPGMPNHFSVWESERCFEWLNRTIRSWSVELQEFYTTPDPCRFWAIGVCQGEVFWANQNGTFQSKFFVRVECHQGKIRYMKGWMDTLAFLRAAGLQPPEIIKDIQNPKVKDFLANMPPRFKGNKPQKATEADPYAGIDMTKEAIQTRLTNNLLQNMCGVEREKYRKNETFHPDYKRDAWFIPDTQPWSNASDAEKSILSNGTREKNAPAELRPSIFAWVKLSSPWMYRDTRGVNYPTDDPQVYFSEMYSNGPACWYGNGCDMGHYHQEYLMYMKFDIAGRELLREEVICPVNKYNSTNIPLPSFPYYL